MRHGLRFLAAFGFYAALAVALTFPLVTSLGTTVPHGLGDAVLNTWILWWHTQAVPLTEAW